MAASIAGFVPWILFWSLTGAGRPLAAALTGLASAVAVCAWDLRRHGRPAPVEATALAFFTAHALVTLALGLDLFTRFGLLLASVSLAVMAFSTLALRAPFTIAYARRTVAPALWESPLFLRTNDLITAAWGAVFSVNTLIGVVVALRPAWAVWLAGVLAHVLIAAGVVFSVLFPRWYPRHRVARELAEADPYRWPPPALAGRAAHAADDTSDVVVVGAGIGGLTAAALLADRGARVTVFEQHYLAGGFCTSWPRLVRRGDERLRFVFDAGVHDVSGLGPRGPVRHLLRTLGIEDQLEWRRMTQEYALPAMRLKVPPEAADFVAALAARFPAEREALRTFFAEMEAVYRELYADVDRTGGVPHRPTTVEETLAYPAAHPHAFRWMQVPFGRMLDMHFRDTGLKQVLSALTGYLTDEPERLTAFAMAPIFGYYFDGGFYPVGGSQTIADALVDAIERRGGSVRLRTPVRRIVVERGHAAGVTLADGAVHRSSAVVANADVRRTFFELVGPERLPADFVARIAALKPSASAFAVFLGIRGVPDLEPITMLDDGEQGLGIVTTSKVDPSLAPAGHSSVTLVRLLPPRRDDRWDRKAPGYSALKRATGEEMIARAGRLIPDLRERIVYRQDGTPATFERYAWTTAGAIYGPALGQWRAPARSPIRGLVLAGSGVFPGAGVEAVVISGMLAADALCAPASAATPALHALPA
jgi:phytoene dehydrogenase-like protein